MKKISLFTPCYNEEKNIFQLYQKVTDIMKELPQYEYEYIFIDNCSTDETPSILRKISSEDKRVKVIFNNRNFGASRSGSYGFFQTSGDASICFACDFQDPPELIPQFLQKWEEGYKVVWGRKTGAEEKRTMYFTRLLYYKLIKSMSETTQYENITGFGLYDKEVMDLLRNSNDPTPNFRNMVGEYGYRIGFVDYFQPVRTQGKSSYNFFRYYNDAIHSLVITSTAPFRIATFLGIFTAAISGIIAILATLFYLIFNLEMNLATILLACSIFFVGAVQLTYSGVMGEYIREILTRQQNKPLVVEKERLNFEEEK